MSLFLRVSYLWRIIVMDLSRFLSDTNRLMGHYCILLSWWLASLRFGTFNSNRASIDGNLSIFLDYSGEFPYICPCCHKVFIEVFSSMATTLFPNIEKS